MSMPSMMSAYEVDAGISDSSVKPSGQRDSSLLENSALLLFLFVTLLWSVQECWWYCNQLVVVDVLQVYFTNPRDCQKQPKHSVNYQLPILAIWKSFLHILKRRHLAILSRFPELFCGCFSIEDNFASLLDAIRRVLNFC